jgi:hypothetical protein
MKEIPLTKGLFTQVDDEDFEYLNQYHWRLGTKGYAESDINGKTTGMHRLILNAPKGSEVDHKDHNKLNNQKYNIRICTTSQNQQNKIPRGTSKYLGVKIVKGKIKAAIKVNNKYIHLGTFKTEKQAAFVYDNAAKKYHGEFANLNFKEK